MKGVHELAGDDADHAAMPAVARHDQHGPCADLGVALHDLAGLGDDGGFLLLPAHVLCVELLGQSPCLIGQRIVGGQQETGRDVGGRHAAGRVDPRRQDEADVVAADALARQARHFQQRAQADLVRALREQVEPELGDDAVLPHQRYDVGQRAKGGDLHEGRQPGRLAGSAAERLHQLQRDADARKVLVRIRAVVALGVDDGNGHRQVGAGLVVVGDDEIDPELARAHCRFVSPDAAVHRDDHRGTFRVQPIDRRRLQPVAVLQAVGDEVADIAAQHLHRPPKDDGRGDAVDIVVAVDDDALAGGECPLEAGDGRLQPRQAHGIVEMVEGWPKESAGVVGIGQSALDQQACDDRLQAERPRQPFGRRLVGCGRLPDGRDHSPIAAASVNALPSRPI